MQHELVDETSHAFLDEKKSHELFQRHMVFFFLFLFDVQINLLGFSSLRTLYGTFQRRLFYTRQHLKIGS